MSLRAQIKKLISEMRENASRVEAIGLAHRDNNAIMSACGSSATASRNYADQLADVLARLPVEGETAERIEELKQIEHRAWFASVPENTVDHSTACLIWGLDGGADPKSIHGNCNCGALVNWHKRQHKKAEEKLAAALAASQPAETLNVEVVVNGQPITLTILASCHVRDVIEPALEKTATLTRPEQEWEVRLAEGAVISLDQPIQPYAGQRLWINLRAGYAASRPAETRWQPIETAPKDGTEVLVSIYQRPTFASWLEHRHAWVGRDQHSLTAPTHWLPLPAPPTEKGA